MTQIGYADFIRIFNVHNPLNWVPGLEVRIDGIWVVPPRDVDDCTPEERATLAEHPENDLSKPALPFPCDHHQLEKFLLWLGMPLEVFVGEKWWPGQEVLKEYGLQGFQLFELLKEGVRARTITGLEVVNEDEAERRGRESLAELKRIEFLKEGAAESGRVITGRGFTGIKPKKRSIDEIKKAAQTAFEKQTKNILIIPKGCEAISYSLSYDDNKKRMSAILRAVGFLFNYVDVIRYIWAHNIKPLESSSSPAQQVQSQQAADITTPVEKHPGHGIPKEKKEPALSLDAYVQKRRADKIDVDVIATELYDKNGPFKLPYLECARALKLEGNDKYIDIMTLKQRGVRAVKRGKQKILHQKKNAS